MPPSSLATAIGTYGHTQALKDGTVRPGRIELEQVLEHSEASPIRLTNRPMVRGLEFDVCEMGLATYLCAKALNKPFTAIPVFPVRGFHHHGIAYNAKSGIAGPKDLEGRKVGVIGAYAVTAGLWQRANLQAEHGVDLDKITWVIWDDEHVEEYQAPANVVSAREGKDPDRGGTQGLLAQMLIAGEFDAAVGAGDVDSPEVRTMFPEERNYAAGFDYFKKTGIDPIYHIVVIKDSLLASDPWIAEELFTAFRSAKQVYLDRLAGGKDLTPEDEAMIRRKSVLGDDPLPYGVGRNRKVLEAATQFAYDQKITPRRFSVEEIFASNTLNLE